MISKLFKGCPTSQVQTTHIVPGSQFASFETTRRSSKDHNLCGGRAINQLSSMQHTNPSIELQRQKRDRTKRRDEKLKGRILTSSSKACNDLAVESLDSTTPAGWSSPPLRSSLGSRATPKHCPIAVKKRSSHQLLPSRKPLCFTVHLCNELTLKRKIFWFVCRGPRI